MSQKANFIATDKAVDDQANAKKSDAKTPALVPEATATKLPPTDDDMVQQILERQAVFGF
ncbi:MAG TPA: hypothetical protein VNU95_00365 [Candidatus Acidoferrales bacterium]|jgi:hypothetical protein|nr:hypothetical protein [Candidatus Acidoferrales bacterium]